MSPKAVDRKKRTYLAIVIAANKPARLRVKLKPKSEVAEAEVTDLATGVGDNQPAW